MLIIKKKKKIELSSSVISIGNNEFETCSSLKQISFSSPSSDISIGS